MGREQKASGRRINAPDAWSTAGGSSSWREPAGAVGDYDDNAMCESCFTTFRCELFDRSSFKTPTEARIAVFDFMEASFVNVLRLLPCNDAREKVPTRRFHKLEEQTALWLCENWL
jgi:hypothetical protein